MFESIHFHIDEQPIFTSTGGIEDDNVSAGSDNGKNRRSKSNIFIGRGEIETDTKIENIDLSKISSNSPLIDVLVKNALNNRTTDIPELFTALLHGDNTSTTEKAVVEFVKTIVSDPSSKISGSEIRRIAFSLLTSNNDRMVTLLSPYLSRYMVECWTKYDIELNHSEYIIALHNLALSVEYIVKPLIESLKDENSYIRFGAWQILLHVYWDIRKNNLISSDEIIEIISTGLKDISFIIRYYAIQLAGKINDIRALQLLLPLLSYKHEVTRLETAYTIYQAYSKETIATDYLIMAYQNEKNRNIKTLIGHYLGNKLPRSGISRFLYMSDDAIGVLYITGMVFLIGAVVVGEFIDVEKHPEFLWILGFLFISVWVFPILLGAFVGIQGFLVKRYFRKHIDDQFKIELTKVIKEKSLLD